MTKPGDAVVIESPSFLARHEVPLIEDDVYGELYQGDTAPPHHECIRLSRLSHRRIFIARPARHVFASQRIPVLRGSSCRLPARQEG